VRRALAATACLACVAGLAAALAACSPAVIPLPEGPDGSTDAAPAEGGSPTSGGDASTDAPSVTAACASYAYTRCSYIQQCSSIALAFRYGSAAVCQQIFTALCVDSLTAPSSGATTETIAGCAMDLNTNDWSCDNFLFGAQVPPGCAQPTGALAGGAPCSTSQQCQSGYCQLPLNGACGACASIPDAGTSCAQFVCPQGLSCVEGTCVAFALQGQGCSTAQPCSEGLTCVASAGASSGTCQAGAIGTNMPCSFTGAGCSFYAGYACNAQTNACATVSLGAPGAGCGTVGDQFASCSGGTCVRGACVANALLGQACDIANGPACADDERCILSAADGGTGGTCQANGFTACP
jgi:hypothetical protein